MRKMKNSGKNILLGSLLVLAAPVINAGSTQTGVFSGTSPVPFCKFDPINGVYGQYATDLFSAELENNNIALSEWKPDTVYTTKATFNYQFSEEDLENCKDYTVLFEISPNGTPELSGFKNPLFSIIEQTWETTIDGISNKNLTIKLEMNSTHTAPSSSNATFKVPFFISVKAEKPSSY